MGLKIHVTFYLYIEAALLETSFCFINFSTSFIKLTKEVYLTNLGRLLLDNFFDNVLFIAFSWCKSNSLFSSYTLFFLLSNWRSLFNSFGF